jgi:hypothetical protein
MNSVRKQWILDVQWSDAPDDVIEETRKIWRDDNRLTNDVCISKFYDESWSFDNSWGEGDPTDEQLSGVIEYPTYYPAIEKWLLENGVPFGEEVWIHWWW